MIIPLTKFNKISYDSRDRSSGACRMITNFDASTTQFTLSPYHSSESGDSAANTSQKQNFCIALRSGTTYNLFSLGRQPATNKAEVLMKTLTTGGSGDLGDNAWSTPSNNQSAIATPSYNLFLFYKTTGLIYGAENGSNIFTFDPTSVASWGSASHSLSYTNIAQGVVHSKDDILYIPYDNKIAKNNNGSWTDVALTLPTNLYITSICEYGNYLAIACAPLSGVGKSIVYLWDRDATLTTLAETIDWGEGVIKILEETEGYLIGISLSGNNSTRFSGRVFIKSYLSGSKPINIGSYYGGSVVLLPIAKQKINNRIYFMMGITLNGSFRDGVWSIGRPDATSPLGLIHEITSNNDTSITTTGNLLGFFIVGDFAFISYIDSAGNYGVSKTDDVANYTATAVIETIINDSMPLADIPKQKQLGALAMTYNPLPAAGQVVLKYKVDGGAYITVFTETTDNAVVTEAQDANGVAFAPGRDYEFRAESTGGAEIVSIIYKYETIKTIINP